MRVGLITGEFAPMQGGVGDFSRELSKALADLGHEVYILTRVGCGADDLPPECYLDPVIDRWGWSLARRVRRWVKAHDLEVINLQYQAAAFGLHPAVNLLPGRMAGAPLAVTFHDLKVPYLFPKAGPLRWWTVLTLARRAAGVIVTNREDQLTLERGRSVGRLALIPIGSNIAAQPPAGYDRAAWRERWGVRPDETLLAYFGFLNESKGGEDLIETLHWLRNKEIPAKLLMVGGRTGSSDATNQAYADRIDALISRLGVQDLVLWTGYTSAQEVSANLLSADACLLPYRDGASFRRGSFMAALAHGLPIITTTPAVDLHQLRHRRNVYLAPPAAPVAYGEAVATLREDSALRERLAAGASALAQEFGWESIATLTAGVFADLTA